MSDEDVMLKLIEEGKRDAAASRARVQRMAPGEANRREHVYHAVCDTYGRLTVDAAMEAGQSVDDIWANGPAYRTEVGA